MAKQHHINFAAYVTTDGAHLKKLYPKQVVQPHFTAAGSGMLYLYCSQHGLFRAKAPNTRRFRQPQEGGAQWGYGNDRASSAHRSITQPAYRARNFFG